MSLFSQPRFTDSPFSPLSATVILNSLALSLLLRNSCLLSSSALSTSHLSFSNRSPDLYLSNQCRPRVCPPHPTPLLSQANTSGSSWTAPSTPFGSRTWIRCWMTTARWPWPTATASPWRPTARSCLSRTTSTTPRPPPCHATAWCSWAPPCSAGAQSSRSGAKQISITPLFYYYYFNLLSFFQFLESESESGNLIDSRGNCLINLYLYIIIYI